MAPSVTAEGRADHRLPLRGIDGVRGGSADHRHEGLGSSLRPRVMGARRAGGPRVEHSSTGGRLAQLSASHSVSSVKNEWMVPASTLWAGTPHRHGGAFLPKG